MATKVEIIAHRIDPIVNRGNRRWCARLVTRGPAGSARNGGKLVNAKGEGTVVQGCFGSKAGARARLKRYPIGSMWTPRKK